MWKKFVSVALASALITAIAGCGSLGGESGMFRDRAQDYRKATTTAPLRVPEDMNSVPLREVYEIPPAQDTFLAPGKFQVPKPVPLVAGAGAELVRIQRLGDASWVLIGVAPGQLWPQVRSFMTVTGMSVAYANATAGVIETGWLPVEGERLSSRFRFRIEQGVQRGTSELYVLQMRQTADERAWPETSDDPARADEMLQSIAQYLADTAETAQVSMIAEQGISAGGKITLVDVPDGDSYLRLELPFDRAWASLGRALERSDFEITDMDRSGGIYYVRFKGDVAPAETSRWSRLWGRGARHPLKDQQFVVTVQALAEQSVTIRLRPQDADLRFENREDQELLIRIRANID